MVDLREMADPMIPHNWQSRAPTARKAIDHIEAQEKEIEALNQEIDRLKSLNASLNEQNVSLAEEITKLKTIPSCQAVLDLRRRLNRPEPERTCRWTLTGDRWVAGCGGTPAPDIPPPTFCECGGLVIAEEFSQSEKDLHHLKTELADADEDDPDDMACSPRDFLHTVAKLLKRTEQAEAEV